MKKNNNEKILTLTGENNKSYDFIIDAEIEYEEDNYLVLRPLSKEMGLDLDEALVFRVDYIDGEDHFEMVDDEEILEAISEIYNAEE